MKKVLLLAAFGFAGMVSANSSTTDQQGNFESYTTAYGGYCHVDVYRQNSDGSSTYIGSWGGYTDSQQECNSKARSITFLLQMGVDAENVTF